MENSIMLSKILIVGFLIAIVYNLGAGLFYMFTDKGGSDRMVKSLTRRIGLSVLLIVLLIIGIVTGVIQPHGVNLG
ncbi:MAG: twin transmembrane helix small protein [Dokdonella sp.]